jgi:hypothetical protein
MENENRIDIYLKKLTFSQVYESENGQNEVPLQKVCLFYKTCEKHHKWDI